VSRNLDSGTIAAISASTVLPAIFLYGLFSDGAVYVWSGIGNISWNGQTWIGLGMPGGECLGAISTISEDSALQAQGTSVTLSGIDSTMLTHALTAVVQGNPVKIWINLFDTNLNVIGTVLAYQGLMDQPTIDEGGDKCSITIAIENRLSDLQRAQSRRWTDQEQRSRYPNDDGFKFANTIINWWATWGGT